MLLRVIAIDYDGTIAEEGTVHPDIRDAIDEARCGGVFVVIVTGRILRELRRVAGDLSFVDGVVAENGAVILLSNGHRRLLGPPPFPELLHELSERGIEFVVGRCLVDMDAEYAAVVLSIIRDRKLPLAISFNRSRMMVLPQSISKSTGLREMLDILGTSSHNAIGIGDGENDYELLKSCEYGIAVEWASAFLKDHADFVLPGKNKQAVADFIRRVSSETRLPVGFARHRNLVLESKKGQQSFEMAIRGRNILIAGDSKSGKSWIAGLFCEQMILQRYTVIVIDPEGDYSSLISLPNTLVLGGGGLLPDIEEMLLLFRQGLSVILNLSHLDHHGKISYVRQLLPLAARFRRSRGYPHSILLDECHYFLDDVHGESILDPELGSYIMVTYRPSRLSDKVLESLEAIVATRMVEKEEVDVIKGVAGGDSSADWYELLKNLETNEAALLPPAEEVQGVPRQFSVAPRLTLHVRHRTKYFEESLRPDQSFVYTDEGRPVGESAATLNELVRSVVRVSEQVLAGHMKRHDFSRWILAVFDDPNLAGEVQKLESTHVLDRQPGLFKKGLAAVVNERYNHNDHSV